MLKHNNEKIDAPSGTALMLADAINEECLNHILIHMTDTVFMKKKQKEIGGFIRFEGARCWRSWYYLCWTG